MEWLDRDDSMAKAYLSWMRLTPILRKPRQNIVGFLFVGLGPRLGASSGRPPRNPLLWGGSARPGPRYGSLQGPIIIIQTGHIRRSLFVRHRAAAGHNRRGAGVRRSQNCISQSSSPRVPSPVRVLIGYNHALEPVPAGRHGAVGWHSIG